MKELKITGTKTFPGVFLNPEGILKIEGRSIHENIAEFYKPVENWIKEYIESPAEVTCLDINLEYFNSASAKLLIRIIQKISYIQLKNKKFMVNWYYEEGDEDILERGEYFSSVTKIPFNFIKTT
jgi:hypothetical protein